MSLGLVNGTRAVRSGLQDFVVASAALAAGAGSFAVVVSLVGDPLSPATDTYLTSEVLEAYWTTIPWTSVLVAAGGGVAGGVLIVVNRRVLATGVVIALGLVPSMTLAILAVAAGEPGLAGRAMLRWLQDVVLVVIACALVFWTERRSDGRTQL